MDASPFFITKEKFMKSEKGIIVKGKILNWGVDKYLLWYLIALRQRVKYISILSIKKAICNIKESCLI